MPELAELKLTSDYVNKVVKGKSFYAIQKNPEHKGESFDVPFDEFNISATSRGKELTMSLDSVDKSDQMCLRVTMGMSGHFRMTRTGEENKHAHLKFLSTDGYTLSFVDVRRFGKWKTNESWSANRGPCPMTEFEDFKREILTNLNKKDFDKPINELMMDQRYFNGIGNYLRAEILYRIDVYPFMPAREMIEHHADEFFNLCRDIPALAYVRGGGEIKDWNNPFKSETDYIRTNDSFFKCYGKKEMGQVVDKTKRRFWYDPKWIKLDMNKHWDYYSGLPNPSAYEQY
jgi:formamidopyrimidine-DNA glycosylase